MFGPSDAEAAASEGGLYGCLYGEQCGSGDDPAFGHGDSEKRVAGDPSASAFRLQQLPDHILGAGPVTVGGPKDPMRRSKVFSGENPLLRHQWWQCLWV